MENVIAAPTGVGSATSDFLHDDNTKQISKTRTDVVDDCKMYFGLVYIPFDWFFLIAKILLKQQLCAYVDWKLDTKNKRIVFDGMKGGMEGGIYNKAPVITGALDF